MPLPRLAITCGEPAGIGPEIAVRAALQTPMADCVLIGDAAQVRALVAQIAPQVTVRTLTAPQALETLTFSDAAGAQSSATASLTVLDCPLAVAPVPGQLDARNGTAVLETLNCAIDAALAGRVDAIVTAPVQKSTINDAGYTFTGHTEYLAEKTGTPRVVMMLAGTTGDRMLRVALATTHLPLREVAPAITMDSLLQTLAILHAALVTQFGIAHPRILVTGLNPHAGEGGYLGREEIEVIEPAIQQARVQGWDVRGPYPADTLFQPRYLDEADAVLAMYHDQGLPVLKFATFGHGVNITLGLPLIRTSVDHGTALDLAAAGLGHADPASMTEAIAVAAQMVASRR